LKSRARIKAHTVFARVQIVAALRTLRIQGYPAHIYIDLRAAEMAASYFSKCGHLWRANVAPLLICDARFFLSLFILIAALFILSFHKFSSY
jgi:hypothetical protein